MQHPRNAARNSLAVTQDQRPALTPDQDTYRHEAFLYAGEREFLDVTLAFIARALADQEPVLVVLPAAKNQLLRAKLNGDAERVGFADMEAVGRNPARIIPAWRQFLDQHSAPGRRLRGIGEPTCATRRPAELAECHRHEALLNLAFADTPGLWLLCPYDTDALDPSVIEEARRNHPFLMGGDGRQAESPDYRGLETLAAPFDQPLPEPPTPPRQLRFDGDSLTALRGFVGNLASEAGLDAECSTKLVTAANELATNSVRHAGGRGVLRTWQQEEALICEVLDDGYIDQPLVGRELPGPDQIGGYGLWLANQLCDLVQICSGPAGSAVRLHQRQDG